MKNFLLILGLAVGTAVGQNCFWTGCKPNDRGTVGCANGRVEKGREGCVDERGVQGNKYNCCFGLAVGQDCWWISRCWNTDFDWGDLCFLYGGVEKGREGCVNIFGQQGIKYNCCTGDSGGEGEGFVNYDQFRDAVTRNGYPTPSQEQYNNFNNFARTQGRISSVEEAAMCLAQFLHESNGLRAKREYACKRTNCPGSYRTPGCDAPNQFYYGRGYIQLTWCYNYKRASTAIFGDNRLVNDADMVARDDSVAWRTAFWYWSERVHNYRGVQQGQFGATTKAINGGECRSPGHPTPPKRFQIYSRVRAAFGLPGAGDSSGCAKKSLQTLKTIPLSFSPRNDTFKSFLKNCLQIIF